MRYRMYHKELFKCIKKLHKLCIKWSIIFIGRDEYLKKIRKDSYMKKIFEKSPLWLFKSFQRCWKVFITSVRLSVCLFVYLPGCPSVRALTFMNMHGSPRNRCMLFRFNTACTLLKIICTVLLVNYRDPQNNLDGW